jgi:hypothetical protein
MSSLKGFLDDQINERGQNDFLKSSEKKTKAASPCEMVDIQ